VTELSQRKCKPCEGGVEPLSTQIAQKLLSKIDSGWQLDNSSKHIARTFRFPAFSRTIAFVNAAAWVATVEGHHPIVEFSYGQCRIIYTTNAIGGLSDNDFICAAKIDRLAADE